MTRTEWMGWLSDWLKRHPVREPSEEDSRAFTDAVMRRIRLAQAPSPQLRWRWQPRWAWALVPAAACAVALAVGLSRAPTQLARHIEQEWRGA